jgi:hypothetical protein
MLYQLRKSVGQTEGHEGVLRQNTTSRNTIKIVLGTGSDLAIAQTQIKVEDIRSTGKMLSDIITNKLDVPLERNKS